ncbi:MAG: DJ-1/PfpI family protein [Mariprofundales bacterium]|nr:DJ-1/PfpI family protein [Mariprofundales bacterium]
MRAIIPFSEGFEEIECLTVVDLLRRAEIEVCLAGVNESMVTGRSQVTIQADNLLDEVLDQDWDMVILPGGLPNAFTLRDDSRVQQLVRRLADEGRELAAICAAPVALAAYGVVGSRRITSYPGCDSEIMQSEPQAIYCDDNAVVEEPLLITSRGPGTSMAFALRLVARLCGEERAATVQQELLA